MGKRDKSNKILIIVVISVLVISGLSVGGYFLLLRESEPEYKHRVAYMGSPKYSPFWAKLGSAIVIAGEEKNILIDDYTPRNREREIKDAMKERIVRENYDAVILGIGADYEFSSLISRDLEYFGIPTFAIDTKIEEKFMKGFVGMSNYESGQAAAEYIYNKINEDGKVLIVTSNMVHDESIQRTRGAEEFFKEKNVDVKIIDGNSTDWDAVVVGETVRLELEKENDWDAIFAVWDEGIIEIRKVMDKMEISDGAIYVGFDGLDFALEAIKNGEIDATIMQDTNKMSNEVFDQITAYLSGKEYNEEILVSGTMITKENVDEYI